jgi:hypothetical protein
MTWMRFGFMTAVKVTDNGLEYQFGSRFAQKNQRCGICGVVGTGGGLKTATEAAAVTARCLLGCCRSR